MRCPLPIRASAGHDHDPKWLATSNLGLVASNYSVTEHTRLDGKMNFCDYGRANLIRPCSILGRGKLVSRMPERRSVASVSFVDLGNLGAPMAHMKTYSASLVDLSSAKSLDILKDKGGRSAELLGRVGRGRDLVGIMVVDDTEIERLVSRGGLLDGLAPGSLIAVHSSAHQDVRYTHVD